MDRRAFLAGSGAMAAGLVFQQTRPAFGAFAPPLIERGAGPRNAESPLDALTTWLTPVDRFFVRNHGPVPPFDPATWRLALEGLVGRPLALSLADLEAMKSTRVVALLQCSGNGRTEFDPPPKGTPWGRGAVGNADWEGVPLKDVLERAGLRPEAKHLRTVGSDPPQVPGSDVWLRSVPLDKAMVDRSIIALRMNGRPLTADHGAPARLVVPGWAGNHWTKWLSKLTATEEEATGKFQKADYRTNPSGPGGLTDPITWLIVKSTIFSPERGARLAPGAQISRGAAWSGEAPVASVELSVDGGPWRKATLGEESAPFGWRPWSFAWEALPGRHVLGVRATDARGQSQPEKAPWNPGGYQWNGIDRVEVVVGA